VGFESPSDTKIPELKPVTARTRVDGLHYNIGSGQILIRVGWRVDGGETLLAMIQAKQPTLEITFFSAARVMDSIRGAAAWYL